MKAHLLAPVLATPVLAAFVLSVLLLVLPARNASAALFAYDGFGDGGDDVSLDGLGGGNGFSGPWSFTSHGELQLRHNDTQPGHDSYYYPANVPLAYTTGVTQRVQAWEESTGFRPLGGTSIDLGADGDYYLSFILRDFEADSNNDASVSFANETNQLHFGYSYTDRFRVGLTSATELLHWDDEQLQADFTSPGDTPYFVVARVLARENGDDEIFLKAYNADTDLVHGSANALSGTGTALDQWTLFATLDNDEMFDHIGLNSAGNHWITLDEIRVGTSWSSVTGVSSVPEPSTAALGLLALGGLLALQRRRATRRNS